MLWLVENFFDFSAYTFARETFKILSRAFSFFLSCDHSRFYGCANRIGDKSYATLPYKLPNNRIPKVSRACNEYDRSRYPDGCLVKISEAEDERAKRIPII